VRERIHNLGGKFAVQSDTHGTAIVVRHTASWTGSRWFKPQSKPDSQPGMGSGLRPVPATLHRRAESEELSRDQTDCRDQTVPAHLKAGKATGLRMGVRTPVPIAPFTWLEESDLIAGRPCHQQSPPTLRSVIHAALL
jgi:hypothetical protein